MKDIVYCYAKKEFWEALVRGRNKYWQDFLQ